MDKQVQGTLESDIANAYDSQAAESQDDDLQLQTREDDPYESTYEEDSMETVEDAVSYEAPESWAADDRERFNSLSDDAKEFTLNRVKEYEERYTNTNQKMEQFNTLIDPFKQDFAQQGMDEISAIRSLLSVYQGLQTNPQETLNSLYQIYGQSIPQQEEQSMDDYEYIDPQVEELQNKVNSLEAYQQTQNQRQLEQYVQSFVDAKNDDGTKKYPFVGDLQNEIGHLFRQGNTLENAYKMALALRPDVQEKQNKAIKTIESRKKAEEVKKAKAAASGVKSQGQGVGRKPAMTLRETIARQYDAQLSKS